MTGSDYEEPVLSKFPSKEECMDLVDRRNRAKLHGTTKMAIGDKRSCFLALRSEESQIIPSMVFMPLGITVGELAVAQVMFANDKDRR